jgi:hypothetical protein
LEARPLVAVEASVLMWSACIGVGERQGSGLRWWLGVEAVASGSMAGISFMGWGSSLHGLGDNLVSPMRRGCRLGRRISEEAV